MLFKQAKPVWEKDKQTEMNYFLRFKASVMKTDNPTVLRLTGSNIYHISINGKFIAMGPARAAHDYYRVDELMIQDHLTEADNVITLEVGGYNVNSFYLLDQPAFLQAEIEHEGSIIAATGVQGFEAKWMKEKLQKVQRYSFQRTFCEEYKLTQSDQKNKTNPILQQVELEQVEEKQLLSRGVAYENYDRLPINQSIGIGSVHEDKQKQVYSGDRSIEGISPIFKGFHRHELTNLVTEEVLRMDFKWEATAREEQINKIQLDANTTRLLDAGINGTGLIHLQAKVSEACKLYLVFDEILLDGDINFLRLGCGNIVKYTLEAGEYELLTVEPYTFRYLKVFVLDGACEISDLHMKQIIAPGVDKTLDTQDEVLKTIYDAAVETYRQNAVDIYMDCPSRERAGWLCDSFFTGRVEHCLTGKSLIERNFLENYLLPQSFKHLPQGMLPMCYPADHYDGVFIPNWAMWLVLELEEYLQRTSDVEMVHKFRDKVYGLINYLQGFENEDGLLEKLPSWVFVEWSKANELVQDVNYPSNMLYAQMLEVASRLYQDQGLYEKSKQIKEIVVEQSYDGTFFVDNSVRKDGKLVSSGERTEVCQYYAFFCNVATPESHPELWNVLLNDFGPQRKVDNKYPEIYFANSFIGNYLRLELFYRQGYYEKVLEEIKGYFYYMAKKTHTLWENDGDYASCNHGFASHVIYWIDHIYKKDGNV